MHKTTAEGAYAERARNSLYPKKLPLQDHVQEGKYTHVPLNNDSGNNSNMPRQRWRPQRRNNIKGRNTCGAGTLYAMP